jgi:hypothetical protein
MFLCATSLKASARFLIGFNLGIAAAELSEAFVGVDAVTDGEYILAQTRRELVRA